MIKEKEFRNKMGINYNTQQNEVEELKKQIECLKLTAFHDAHKMITEQNKYPEYKINQFVDELSQNCTLYTFKKAIDNYFGISLFKIKEIAKKYGFMEDLPF